MKEMIISNNHEMLREAEEFSVSQRRIQRMKDRLKYSDKATKLVIQDGKAELSVLGREGEPCVVLSGYIKVPWSEYVYRVEDIEGKLEIYVTESGKIIMVPADKEDQGICRGYKSKNTKGCIFCIYAATEEQDLLIEDFTQDDESPLIVVEEVDNIYKSSAEIAFLQAMHLMNYQMTQSKLFIKESSAENGEVDDEWQ